MKSGQSPARIALAVSGLSALVRCAGGDTRSTQHAPVTTITSQDREIATSGIVRRIAVLMLVDERCSFTLENTRERFAWSSGSHLSNFIESAEPQFELPYRVRCTSEGSGTGTVVRNYGPDDDHGRWVFVIWSRHERPYHGSASVVGGADTAGVRSGNFAVLNVSSDIVHISSGEQNGIPFALPPGGWRWMPSRAPDCHHIIRSLDIRGLTLAGHRSGNAEGFQIGNMGETDSFCLAVIGEVSREGS